MLRKLTRDDVQITIRTEQDDTPVRGNAMASGDDDFDRKTENEILARLNRGDSTAWCLITVEARWRGFVGRETLSCCSFPETTGPGNWDRLLEEEVRDHGLVESAIGDLNDAIECVGAKLADLEKPTFVGDYSAIRFGQEKTPLEHVRRVCFELESEAYHRRRGETVIAEAHRDARLAYEAQIERSFR